MMRCREVALKADTAVQFSLIELDEKVLIIHLLKFLLFLNTYMHINKYKYTFKNLNIFISSVVFIKLI